MGLDTLERVEVRSADALHDWLDARGGQTASVWLVTFKKSQGNAYLSYDDAVNVLICHGWIDSVPRKLDDARTMTLIAPRKAGSAWSAINKRRVARMREAGRMRPAGEAAVNAAKADGSWSFLDDVERLEKPTDLSAALDAEAGAAAGFDALPPSARRGILEWIKTAKKPQTRAARIAKTAAAAARGERPL